MGEPRGGEGGRGRYEGDGGGEIGGLGTSAEG